MEMEQVEICSSPEQKTVPGGDWTGLDAFIQEQIDELLVLLHTHRYAHKHAQIQQLLAVMMARKREVHVLAGLERDKIEGKAVDPSIEVRAQARLSALFPKGVVTEEKGGAHGY